MQYFKGDDLEKKMESCAKTLLDDISLGLDDFFEDAYNCQALGDIIFESKLSPLSRAIQQNIFRSTFNEVFQNFSTAGSFESYIAIFEKVFGDSVGITFTVPAAGRLQIDIEAEDVELSDFVSRYIEANTYFFDNVIDYDLDNIAFQTIKGFQTQYELEQMLFELVPAGVFTEITLTLGA